MLELLSVGADIHAKDESGQTALHLASSEGLEEVAQALIDQGSRVDELDTNGNTLLMYRSGNVAMCLL